MGPGTGPEAESQSLGLWAPSSRVPPPHGTLNPEAPEAPLSALSALVMKKVTLIKGRRERWPFLGGTHSARLQLWVEVTLFSPFWRRRRLSCFWPGSLTAARVCSQDQQKHIPEPPSLTLGVVFATNIRRLAPLRRCLPGVVASPGPHRGAAPESCGKGTAPRIQGLLSPVPLASLTPGPRRSLEFS